MKFTHMADCHIGGWRDPKMQDVVMRSFQSAINTSIEKKVDFILISGDLFNTSLPGIETLKTVTLELKKLKDHKIPVYIVPGSHDFSPSGKTMLDVLQAADLLVNVVRGTVVDGKLRLEFTKDATGSKITGMLGKRGMLERVFYEDLDRKNLEAEDGFKIFMFHTALTEFKSKDMEKMDSAPLSLLPKGFDYYAGGHVHEVLETSETGYKKIVYPGPIFPNSFSELEKLKHGGFYLYNNGSLHYEKLVLRKTVSVNLDCDNKIPEEIESMLNIKDIEGKILTIRLHGRLKAGKITDIPFRRLIEEMYDKGAYFVMKNTVALRSHEFEEVKIHDESVDEIEEALISEHTGQMDFVDDKQEKKLVVKFMNSLNTDKKEGETVQTFQKRIIEEMEAIAKDLF